MKPKLKTLRAVRPNAGIELAFRKKLLALIEEMHNSVVYWLIAAYRANQPEIAQDASPAAALRAAVRKLTRRWQTRFNDAGRQLGAYFAKAAGERSDAVLRKILKDAGISVEFKMTAAQNDVLQASINESVSLIKSIPATYLQQVEGAVMRSVQTGRDLGSLAKELELRFHSTKKRAAFIAQSQNSMVTASLNRARQIELGITKALWVHSSAGKVPRPSHVKAGRDKVEYDVSTGWFDPHEKEWIIPGQLPRCRCVSKSVIPGFA